MKVWVNGCFDVLHIGHIKLLEFASKQGTHLRVGLDSDEKIRLDKGLNRPINKLIDRMEIVGSIKFVSSVVSFNSREDLILKIKEFSPEVLVVGEEYRDKEVVGGNYAKNIIFFPKINGYSSTNIIESLYEINYGS